MKILHIVSTYVPAYRYGGPIKSVHELNKELVKSGAEVVVYTTNIDGRGVLNVPLEKGVIIDGVKIFYFPISFRKWQYSRKLHLALSKNIKYFDLIHVTSVFLSVSFLGSYYANKFNKPYIISPRGSLMAEPLRKNSLLKNIYLNLIEKRNLKKSAAIHFTAETEKEEYIKSGLPLSKPIVIPNGFEEGNALGQKDNYSLKKKFNIEFHKKIILFLSRLSWKKGLDTLIPAFGQVLENEPDAILVIGGGDDEGYGKEIVKMVNDLNLKNSVYFIGAVNPKERISLFKECDVFVLSSYAENFGIVVLEAIDGNLPVIITEGVGISKEIRNNEAGIVVKKDEKELREAILWVLNNREESRKMVLNGKKMIVKYFYWPEIAKKFLKEYNELIKKKQL